MRILSKKLKFRCNPKTILGLKIDCQCKECDCHEKFETIETEELINLIQHGRLNQEQIAFLKTRVGSKVCKYCFTGKHKKQN